VETGAGSGLEHHRTDGSGGKVVGRARDGPAPESVPGDVAEGRGEGVEQPRSEDTVARRHLVRTVAGKPATAGTEETEVALPGPVERVPLIAHHRAVGGAHGPATGRAPQQRDGPVECQRAARHGPRRSSGHRRGRSARSRSSATSVRVANPVATGPTSSISSGERAGPAMSRCAQGRPSTKPSRNSAAVIAPGPLG